MIASTEVAILSRIIDPDKPEIPGELAKMILRWKFSGEDLERMHSLLDKAKAGKLTTQERSTAANYERVGYFLSMLKSKARISLKSHKSRR